ncbi:MAG: tetratricopeptide repeat protein [Candidatus Krumholzibacteriota bacterium]|nr:tetratricopeptide repeat protein [Candidatus Krumholzibacteriota bacterium]
MKYRPAVLFLSLTITGVLVSDAVSQKRPRTPAHAEQYEITSRTSDAMRYLSTDPDRALTLLQALNRQYPGQERVLSRLGYVYQVVGELDSAQVYYSRALEVNPGSLEAGKSLGMMHYAQGMDEDGFRVFSDVISANGNSMSAYKVVGNALRDLGRYDDALRMFEDGRDKSPRHFVLTLEIAALHQRLGNYEWAIDEYLHYIGEQSRNYRFTRTKILDALRAAGRDQDAIVSHLNQRLEAGEGNRYATLDILSAWYLIQGFLEKSLDMALLADAESDSDGTVLLVLADEILTEARVQPMDQKQRYLELGVRALDAFARNHPRQPGTDRAKYFLATIYVEFGSGHAIGRTKAQRKEYLEKAVVEYAELSKRYPNSDYAEISFLERGDVLLRKLKRPREALDAYRSGAVNSRRMSEVFAARIGDIYLGIGEFDSARDYFAGMMDSGVPVLVQTGYYYNGVMLAYRGEYVAARDTLTFLAEEDPSSVYTNDAIELAWTIEEALQNNSKSLGSYLEAMRAGMVGDTTAVISRLNDVAESPVYEPLRPRALYWLGTVRYDAGDLYGSLEDLQRFLREYPEEDLRPDVQRQIAAVYEHGLGQYERALQEYESVLVSYPEYAFLDEVRKDVRRLRYIVKGEEYEN